MNIIIKMGCNWFWAAEGASTLLVVSTPAVVVQRQKTNDRPPRFLMPTDRPTPDGRGYLIKITLSGTGFTHLCFDVDFLHGKNDRLYGTNAMLTLEWQVRSVKKSLSKIFDGIRSQDLWVATVTCFFCWFDQLRVDGVHARVSANIARVSTLPVQTCCYNKV